MSNWKFKVLTDLSNYSTWTSGNLLLNLVPLYGYGCPLDPRLWSWWLCRGWPYSVVHLFTVGLVVSSHPALHLTHGIKHVPKIRNETQELIGPVFWDWSVGKMFPVMDKKFQTFTVSAENLPPLMYYYIVLMYRKSSCTKCTILYSCIGKVSCNNATYCTHV